MVAKQGEKLTNKKDTTLRVEKLKKKSIPSGKKGGKRPGAGRKRGGVNRKTLEEKLVFEELRQRVLAASQRILDAQLSLAQGVSYLYRIDTITGPDGKERKQKPELVTDLTEIEAYLSGDTDGDRSSYYYITTERPDNRSIDSLFDRVFGKAPQSIDLTSKGKELKTNVTISNFHRISELAEDASEEELLRLAQEQNKD